MHYIRFQYISCYCLSKFRILFKPCVRISIHLMLLFIGMLLFFPHISATFQYISCYCLSKPDTGMAGERDSFQYISCYCLSICSIGFIFHCPISIHLMLLFIVIRASLSPISYRFQYISCYCLSSTTHRSLEQSIYFNTSHVTVYLRDLI